MALPSLVFAQIDSTSIATAKTHVKKYISGGISIGNVNPSNPGSNTFSKASYASIEGGIVWKNATLGLVLGPENFFATSSTRMCYELKTTYSVPIEQFSVYGLFGTGAYFEKKFNNYIEYGAGVAYSPNSFSYFVQYSNWASCNYVSTGVAFSF